MKLGRFDTDTPGFYRWRGVGFYIVGPCLVVAWVEGWISEAVLIAITLLVSFFTQGATDVGTYRVEQAKRNVQRSGNGTGPSAD